MSGKLKLGSSNAGKAKEEKTQVVSKIKEEDEEEQNNLIDISKRNE